MGRPWDGTTEASFVGAVYETTVPGQFWVLMESADHRGCHAYECIRIILAMPPRYIYERVRFNKVEHGRKLDYHEGMHLWHLADVIWKQVHHKYRGVGKSQRITMSQGMETPVQEGRLL